ncbi:MAG: hypothetical protein WD767_20070 [Alphaproteobacteria bacterium]
MKIESVRNRAEGGFIVNGTMVIPADPANRHFRTVRAWIAAGNIPAVAAPPLPPEPGDREVVIQALENRANISAAERAAARAAIINRRGSRS